MEWRREGWGYCITRLGGLWWWEEHEAASGDEGRLGWACSLGAAVLPKPNTRAQTRKERKKDEISTTVRRDRGRRD